MRTLNLVLPWPLPASTSMLALCAGLAACSSEPSSGDVEAAVRQKFEMAQIVAAEMAGKKLAKEWQTTVHAVRVVGCKPGESKTVYTCDTEIDMTAPLLGRTKQQLPLVLIKGPQGWQMAG
ncbi:MAG: hypothetical protein Q8M96_17200 [Rubrivivax sp.]|nr:hypothetical protein [Rubrivivax sp.]